ncbi:MAG: hypothetical protein JXA96_13470 [Sedimentisphaerales bacterium]|nr:hypothetical protein [Sedimentisphaerales bacterium]
MKITKMNAMEIENKIDEMLECIDVDIEHIQTNLSRLNELRALVIKRDDAQLMRLLNDIQMESDSYRGHELKRQMIRRRLANLLGCKIEKVTLSNLATMLAEEKRNYVSAKKALIKSLVESFKSEYASTIILVSECSRFNKMLIKSIFEPAKTNSVYYNPNGKVREHRDNNKPWLVNCDL